MIFGIIIPYHSTVQECDRIFVVDDGRIAESGTYDEQLDS